MKVPLLENREKEPLLTKVFSQQIQKIRSRNKFHRCKTTPAQITDVYNTRDRDTKGELPSPLEFKASTTLIQAFIISTIYLSLGIIYFYSLGDEMQGVKTSKLVDALYFSVVIMTTLGYGDLVPKGVVSKLLICAFVFSGVTLVGVFLSSATDYLLEKEEKLLIKAIHVYTNNNGADFEKEDETQHIWNKVLVSLMVLTMLITVGLFVITKVEGFSVLDSFYFVCCTITTLGYGDMTFTTETGRIFAVFWIPLSTVCVGHFILRLAEFKSVGRQQALVHWVMTRPITASDLEAADLDSDGAVCPAEFVVYKLKEMGKIKEEDVALVLKEFDCLDIRDSGKLTKYDLNFIEQVEKS